jgi:hypothetical protein
MSNLKVHTGGNRSRTKTKKSCHPLLVGREKGVWHPDLVDKGIKGYPSTYEDWKRSSDSCREQIIRLNAAGRANRKGVPDGFAGRRDEVVQIKERAAIEAKEIVKQMARDEMIDIGEDPRAEEALEDAVAIIRAADDAGQKVYQARERLAAGKLLLEYLKAKPVARSKVELDTAESFLARLAGK